MGLQGQSWWNTPGGFNQSGKSALRSPKGGEKAPAMSLEESAVPILAMVKETVIGTLKSGGNPFVAIGNFLVGRAKARVIDPFAESVVRDEVQRQLRKSKYPLLGPPDGGALAIIRGFLMRAGLSEGAADKVIEEAAVEGFKKIGEKLCDDAKGELVTDLEDYFVRPGKKPQEHHLLPVQYREEFEGMGLDVDNFAVKTPYPLHRAIHEQNKNEGLTGGGGMWNSEWRKFFEENESPTSGQALQKMNDLSQKYGLDLKNVQRYSRAKGGN